MIFKSKKLKSRILFLFIVFVIFLTIAIAFLIDIGVIKITQYHYLSNTFETISIKIPIEDVIKIGN